MPHNVTISAVRAVGVEIPMTYVLGSSRGALTKANLVLVNVETDAGVTGHGYVFSHMPDVSRAIISILCEIERIVTAQPLAPLDLYARIEARFALIGMQGVIRMALAGFDIAAWDALAVSCNMPLARLIGAAPKPIRAYNSCGLGLMAPDMLADEAEKLLGGRFDAVKLRLGYPTLKEDIAAVRAVKRRVPDSVLVMTDYNQALTLAEALERGRALDCEGIYWLEEPIRHDDYQGSAALRDALDVPVQIGENFSLAEGMAAALRARASDWVMPDLERIGGVTGWQRAAALASANGIEMSSHLFPEVSVHLLAATPTAHWLEYVDWADKILQQPLDVVDGRAVAREEPGNGLVWDAKAVERYRVA